MQIGLCITLIKSNFSSLAVYFMFLFVISRKMSLRLEKFQREFLWGGFSLEKKPYVIKWLIACMERRKGCLGSKIFLSSIRHFLASVVGDMLRSGLLLGIRGKRGGWCSRELKVGFGAGSWTTIRREILSKVEPAVCYGRWKEGVVSGGKK